MQWGDEQMNSLSLTTDQCGDVTPLPEFNLPGAFLKGKCPEDLKLKSWSCGWSAGTLQSKDKNSDLTESLALDSWLDFYLCGRDGGKALGHPSTSSHSSSQIASKR